METETVENSRQEQVEQAVEPAGECVLANGRKGRADSIHNIKLELLRLNTGRQVRVVAAQRMVKQMLFRYQAFLSDY